MQTMKHISAMPAMMAFMLIAQPSLAQKAGQSVSVQYGKVTAGALVGGALGLASASGKSSSKKARNAIIGTAAGSAVAGAAQGSQKGMMYQVEVGAGSMIQVVSDQREIRTGDCVAVERAGD